MSGSYSVDSASFNASSIDQDSGHEDQLSDQLDVLSFTDNDGQSASGDSNGDKRRGVSLLLASEADNAKPSTKTVSGINRGTTMSWNDDTIDSKTPRRTGYRVTFEIITAKTIGTSHSSQSKYVVYTILVKRSPGLETQPGLIERRYSDFLTLYQALKKRFTNLMADFPFPKKMLVGNFTADVITARSIAFQHLLAYCLSVPELRETQEFANFLYRNEGREVHRQIKAGNFEEACAILENSYYIQEKLYLHSGDMSFQAFKTLCALIACNNAINNIMEAQLYAEKAMNLISLSTAYDSSELMVPFLALTINLFRANSVDVESLEERINKIRQKGIHISIEKEPTLLELVIQKDFLSNSS